jgi:uncharacterized protein involved in outer membrane biogenesis
MSTSPASPRRSRRALWLIAIPLLLAGVAWGALTLLFPPARVRVLVSTQLSTALAREVRFADASIGLWPPVRLSVRQPAIAEPGGFARGVAFQAHALHLDLDLLPLLSRRLVVRRLVLDQAAVHLVLNPDGTTNFDGMMKPSAGARPSGGAMTLDIRELRLFGARVLVDDLKAARRSTFAIESRVALKAEGGGERFATSGETMISELAFGPSTASRLVDLNQSLARLQWRIAHDGKFDTRQKRLALGRLGLRLGRTDLTLSGIIDDPGPRARLDLRTRASAVDLGAVLGYLAAADARAVHGVSGRGQLDFELRVTGMLGPDRLPTLAGTLSVKNGAVRYPGAPTGIDALAFTARLAPDSLWIGDLRARVDGQPVQAALSATRFADPWVRFAVKGNIDLAAVAPLVAPADTKLGGRVAVDVRGTGRAKDPGALALEGDATLHDVSVQSPALPQKIENVHGTVRFTPARASVSGFGASAGKSSFALEATVTRPLALLAPASSTAGGAGRVAPAGVDFDLSSPYLDLAELLPTTPGAPLLPNATGGGRVHIGRLRNQKLDVEDVTARVTLEPGVLVVPEYALRAYRGAAVGNARFDVRDPARPTFEVRSQVDSLEADAVLSAWTPVRNLLHGSLNTTLALAGEGLTPADLKRSITAVGLAAVANGTLGPGPALEALARYTRVPAFKQLHFKDGHFPFRVQQGRVVTDPVVLNGPNGEWKFVGSVGFDGSLDYVVSATLPPEVVANLGARSALTAGALADAQGRLFLDLRLKGTAAAPQVSWDGQAMRDRLLGRASLALEEQRARLEGEARAAADAHAHAASDSARAAVERAKQAAADSLRRLAGDALKGLFGGPPDTTKR